MKWVSALRDAIDKARKVTQEAYAIIDEIHRVGGIALPCGCFIGVQSDDLKLVMKRANPQEVLLVIKKMKEGHYHPKSWRSMRIVRNNLS